jgi:transcriptional regulator with GAF, ATPase, and Fis domain/predicted Ser/Thr protein kinase
MARYRRVKQLGRGAQGGVHLVEDRVLGGPLLALKRVEQASADAMRDAFAREFAVLASLAVPGVARVHDLGVAPALDDAPAGPFFTRDYVAGEPLGEWVSGQPLDAIVSVFLRVLRTVSLLHRRAVVHGDLHPGNVIVDADGMPHLIDFGLASRGADALEGSGTPLFMAPELFTGGRSSMSADIYALGATLWAAITGSAPLAELGPRLIAAKLRGELPTLSAVEAGPRTLVLEAALWALAPLPRERAPSADELAARIERACGLPARQPHEKPAFVQPRPRGRGELLDALVRHAREPVTDPARERGVTVVHGACGMGKSTLLRELKWRLQLEGIEVLEVRCRDRAVSPIVQLVRQLAPLSTSLLEVPPPADELPTASETRVALERLETALRSREGARRVLLVDDLDVGDAALAQLLRALTQHDGTGRGDSAPVVIASSDSLSAPGVSAFVDVEALAVTPLSEADARTLITDALGPVDAATAEALLSHAAGNPGILLEALAWLYERGDPTALDVTQLEPGAIAGSLAEARLAPLSPAARELLSVVALARSPLPATFLAALFGSSYETSTRELFVLGLAHVDHELVGVSESFVEEALRRKDVATQVRLASAALGCDAAANLDVVSRLELALVAKDPERARTWVIAALRSLSARGAASVALRVAEATLALGVDDIAQLLVVAELYVDQGDCARGAEYGERVLAEPSLDALTLARAQIAAARAHVGAARLERAIELLAAVSPEAPATLRAQAARELSRVQLRRGGAAEARAAVDHGLVVAAPHDLHRAELLAIDATLASQAGEHERAARRFDDALAIAREHQALRDEAQVLGYRALSHERRGAYTEARADFEAGMSAARRAGDLGVVAAYALNLGTNGFRTGVLEGVEQHYTLAARLSRRSGRTVTALLADNNLAQLHLYLGSFARARVIAEASLAEAERLGSDHSMAKALNILADVDGRAHEMESALARYEAAAACYTRLGRTLELAEVWLDASELLLERGGVSDVSAASAKVALARATIERHGHDELRPRLKLLLARARAGNGDVEGALQDLAEVERMLSGTRDRETLWQVLAAAAGLHAQLGASLLAERKAREAAELIELLASQVPREAREAFCADPRRRAVLDLARQRAAESGPGERSERAPTGLDEPRFARLLELIKRLARERDLPRLLERITDAAVDLSGAERGFVLLVDPATGQLAPHTVRSSGGAETDPHVAFSRSIAEAVLIDGEPIVTINARDDRRLNEFMSVHKLMLKSVACIPISGPVGVVGVLYLEHRLRAGRFLEDDVDLLVAFADQAAIALENARLWSENALRSKELLAQTRELALAKSEIERLLDARTEELEQVRRDLGRARAELEGQSSRHGMVGHSASMRRVFALIERVADSPVPIIVEGESGTGKELAARAIHFSGARKKEPFVALNCAALPEHLVESELFGHVRGAFTGADRDKKGLFLQAQGGTIFLDEFADIPHRMQIDLLRVLQERCIRPVGGDRDIPVDVRIIAASNRPLKQLVATGKLREDLYYRMSVVEIRLPALRERTEDIPLLCDHLLSRIAGRDGSRPRKLSRLALERVLASELPGNVRQLEHLLTSAAMLADGPLIEPEDLALDAPTASDDDLLVEAGERSSEPPGEAAQPGDVQGFKTREKRRIIDALEKHGWNRAKAAVALGMPRRTFYRRLTEFNIL